MSVKTEAIEYTIHVRQTRTRIRVYVTRRLAEEREPMVFYVKTSDFKSRPGMGRPSGKDLADAVTQVLSQQQLF